MIFADNDLSVERAGLTLVPRETSDEQVLSTHHRHAWVLVTNDLELQTAEQTMGWDRNKSRIIGVNRCTFCAGLHRGSVRECSASHCRTHAICAGRA